MIESPGWVSVQAQASDRSGVGRVSLHLRLDRAGGFNLSACRRSLGDQWMCEAEVPGGVREVGFYLTAYDALGNGPSHLGSTDEPMRAPCVQAVDPGRHGRGVVVLFLGVLAGTAWAVSRRLGRDAPPVRPGGHAPPAPAASPPRVTAGRQPPSRRDLVAPVALRPISERRSSVVGAVATLDPGSPEG